MLTRGMWSSKSYPIRLRCIGQIDTAMVAGTRTQYFRECAVFGQIPTNEEEPPSSVRLVSLVAILRRVLDRRRQVPRTTSKRR